MRFISVLIITILFASCKKEQLDPTLPIVGKWAMTDIVTFSTEVPLLLHTPNIHFVKPENITVEITTKGKLIYDSEYGKESFDIIKNDIVNFEVDYEIFDSPIYSVQGHIFTVKNWKGKKFQFKFFYDPVINRLIGVAWYKGISYNTYDKPVTSGYHYGHFYYQYTGVTYLGWNVSDVERLGVFKKI